MGLITWDDFPEQFQDKFTQFGITISPTSTRDAQIAIASNRAESMFYANTSRRYAANFPFAANTVPQMVKDTLLSLTIFFMVQSNQVVSPAYTQGYEDAKALIQLIKDGEIDIFDSTNSNLLSEFDSNYGFESDYSGGGEFDEDEQTYKAFPRTSMPPKPSTMPQTTREEN